MQKRAVTLCLLVLILASSLVAQQRSTKCSPVLHLQERSTGIQDFQLVVQNLPAFLTQLEKMKADVQLVGSYKPAGIAVVRTDFSFLINQILPLPEIIYADRAGIEIREELPVPGHNLLINKISALQTTYPGLNGAGRTISVKEFLFDTLDIDLWGRVAPVLLNAGFISPHAALMATLVAGAGNSGPAGRGVAWGARVSSSYFGGLLPDSNSAYVAQDVTVQNHSYGFDIENYYSASAMAYDYSVALRPELVHVFSAGNSGDTSAAVGSYTGISGFANLTGSFKMAKNVLLVGAVDSFGHIRSFSSRGPAYDGRLKPDLVAFGQDGSSGAAALVSGTAAILQQAYAAKHQGVLPNAALVRALLINGADDVGVPGPDYASGFGNLNALNSVLMLDAGHFVEAEVSNSDSSIFKLDLPAGNQLLKITLTWDDPPAPAGAAKAQVHDLNLKLTGPDGQSIWLPFVLNILPNADSLSWPSRQGVDTLNTVEQIVVPNPEAGLYQITVYGRNIATATQPFALAYFLAPKDTFRWIAPTRMMPPAAGSSAGLYWEQNFDQPYGTLAFRYAGQPDWQILDAQVPLKPGFYRWPAPDTLALAQLRMTIDGQSFFSDSFLITPAMFPRVGFYCPDSALVYWNGVAPQTEYLVWGLGDKYLEPLFSTADTFAVLERTFFPQDRIAVSVRAPFGITGLRSGAMDISRQGLDCYFRSLLANFDDQEQVRLQLQLGTTYGLQQVFLEKWRFGEGFIPLETWNWPFNGEQFETMDAVPNPGPNYYRAQLLTGNVSGFVSDTITLYYGGRAGYFAYPNPLSGQGSLQLAVQEPSDDAVFKLYDQYGRFLLEKTLDESLETILLPALAPGVYLYNIRQGGRVVHSGKLLIAQLR